MSFPGRWQRPFVDRTKGKTSGEASTIGATGWSPMPGPLAAVLILGFAIILWPLATHGPQIGPEGSAVLSFLHDINLVFHEAGHVLFGPFGRTLTILGGSLMQLLVPLAVAISFLKRRDAAGFAVGGFWFFENFIDLGVYIADARALALPLIHNLGPESHDWHNLLRGWGLLRWDTAIAAASNAIGGLGMTWAVVFVVWRYTRYRKDVVPCRMD